MKKRIKYTFVSAIIIAICVLPALYAWINIYANKDPYANTKNIEIALASNDKGIDVNGKHINSADEVISALKNNKSIEFKLLNNSDITKDKVKSGDFYAAIVFEGNFTDNMYNMEKALNDKKPTITYYTNGKKNPVASKITDTAAENVLKSINDKYLETVFYTFFNDTKKLTSDLKDTNTINNSIKKLTKTRNDLANYDKTVKLFIANNKSLENSIYSTKSDINSDRQNSKKGISNIKQDIKGTKKTIKTIKDEINKYLTNLKNDVDSLEKSIDKLKNTTDEETKQKIIKEINAKTDKILVTLEKLLQLIPEDSNSKITKSIRNTLTEMIKVCKDIKKSNSDINTLMKDIESLKQLEKNSLKPNFKTMISEFNTALELIKPILSSGKSVLDDINPILDASLKTSSGINSSMDRLDYVLTSSVEKIDEVLNKLKKADTDEKTKILTEFFGGDSEEYSKFFTSLVDVKTKKIYTADNYGTAMTPFYSVLAIWVGGVILVSVLNLNTNNRKFEGKSEVYTFFRKFIPFFILGQIQAAIIVLGDIILLNIIPVHPLLLFVSAAITSLVFVMLIYSLAISFGDIGKGIVVFIMVLQISGSSGSFPIELLPEVFEKIYRFFPFPYAINAMREALCGVYNYDFIIYLGQLFIFFIVGIIIGLVIRRPFIKVNSFVNEKLEETEVL